MTLYYSRFEEMLEKKRKATQEELNMYVPTSRGRYVMKLDDSIIPLDPEDEQDHLDSAEMLLSEEDNPYWDEAKGQPECESTPDEEDHRSQQTAIRNQQDRGTCVCFASLACLESIIKRDNKDIDLSEQYANWLYMRERGSNQCDDGLRTTLAARYLTNNGICEETYAPYENVSTVRQHCHATPSKDAKNNARYGIKRSTIIDRLGPLGPSISNPAYLECVLAKGHDIVFGTHVAWGRPDENGVLDVILDQYGNPLRSRGGHAMLLVGYSKIASIPYLIFKNSWGTSKGNEGYYYLSYDYIIEYAKYGYIVHEMRSNFV
jgi:C1A family cysteine protease